MAEEITLDQALAQVQELTKENAALKSENADLKTKAGKNKVLEEALEEVEALKLELAAQKETIAAVTKEVPGTYKSNKTKKEYRFKKGRFHIVFNGEKVAAADLLKDSKAMEALIEMRAGSIEEVTE
jgi:regulator of replication initiation timing